MQDLTALQHKEQHRNSKAAAPEGKECRTPTQAGEHFKASSTALRNNARSIRTRWRQGILDFSAY